MNAPLTKKTLARLESLFRNAQESCNEKFQEHVEEAEKQGKDFKKVLSKEPMIKDHLNVLRYFADKDFLADGRTMLDNFKKFIERSQEIIQESKNYAELDFEAKELLTRMKRVLVTRNEKDFAGLAQALIALREQTDIIK